MFKAVVLSLFLCLNLWGDEPWQEGIALFHQKKYEQASIFFEKESVYRQKPIGALIGRLFCSVALGHWREVDATLLLIDQKLEEYSHCKPPPKSAPLTPEEWHASYLCRHKVREVAAEMRQTVEQLVRETVPGIFQKIKTLRQLYPFIDALERTSLDCCQNNLPWKCCLDPLLQQLEVWNSFGLMTST